jgi:Arc/MetJ-type ribon-helix-helix transcriptional regulator
MKREYNLSKGRRGAVVPLPPEKARITIRLDREIVDHFRDQVRKAHRGNYQTLINEALRDHLRRPSNRSAGSRGPLRAARGAGEGEGQRLREPALLRFVGAPRWKSIPTCSLWRRTACMWLQ